ncbi:MAG: hypothetical protein M1552_02080 [Firmicutes bacterium]|jgi:hypothetical protein|nr:hypothetical protein [Bacillota bacterium]MCL5992947.1 hypothetical protein [Bacillota bacterium]
MSDRFTVGFIAGLTAGIAYLSWSLFSRHVLGFAKLSIAEYSAALTFNRSPHELGAIHLVWGGVAALCFAIAIGIIFSFLLLLIDYQQFYLKAIIYSWAAWYILIDILIIRLTDAKLQVAIETAISASINATLYGAILAFVYLKIGGGLRVRVERENP